MLNFKNTFHLFPPLQNLNLISRWRYSHLHVTDWTSQKKHLWFALLYFTLATEGWNRFLFLHSPAGWTATETNLSSVVVGFHGQFTGDGSRGGEEVDAQAVGHGCDGLHVSHLCGDGLAMGRLLRRGGIGPSFPFDGWNRKPQSSFWPGYPQFHTHLKNVCVKLKLTWANSLLTVETENHSYRFGQVTINFTRVLKMFDVQIDLLTHRIGEPLNQLINRWRRKKIIKKC